jgi:hypothetical protein
MVVLTSEQRRPGESRAEVKTGSVVVRKGKMKRGSFGDVHARDKDVEESAQGAVVISGVR